MFLKLFLLLIILFRTLVLPAVRCHLWSNQGREVQNFKNSTHKIFLKWILNWINSWLQNLFLYSYVYFTVNPNPISQYFTSRTFCVQNISHPGPFAYRIFHIKDLWHTEYSHPGAFAYRIFHIQDLLLTEYYHIISRKR